jgi:hypothetical protein
VKIRRPLPALALVVALAAALTCCAAAFAAPALTQPQAGAWKFGEAAGGFSLVHGKGKHRGTLYLTNVHSLTQNFVGCPEKPEKITVSGRFPLKVVKLEKIYPVWAVGKPGTETRYSDGDTGLVSIPAKVKVNGKPVPGGGIKMDFSSEDPTAFSILIIEYTPDEREEPCITYSESASHG